MDLSLSQPSSPRVSEPREDEHVVKAAKSLRRHIGHEETSNEDTPSRQWSPGAIFWVESAPPSSGGAKCRLPCPEKIMPGEYRIAVIPGQHSYYGRDSTDYYHISCFETIADFSQLAFVDRVQPVTRDTWQVRNLKATSILDGNFLMDAGAERLLLEWKKTVISLIGHRDARAGTPETLEPDSFDDLLANAGSSKFVPRAIADLSDFDYDIFRTTLAPFESDGPDDNDEWNLFEQYLAVRDGQEGALDYRHSLSETLNAWKRDIRRTFCHQGNAEDGDGIAELGPKAIRAVTRLAVTPRPDIQGAFGRGR